jgi:hypothetical protein
MAKVKTAASFVIAVTHTGRCFQLYLTACRLFALAVA